MNQPTPNAKEQELLAKLLSDIENNKQRPLPRQHEVATDDEDPDMNMGVMMQTPPRMQNIVKQTAQVIHQTPPVTTIQTNHSTPIIRQCATTEQLVNEILTVNTDILHIITSAISTNNAQDMTAANRIATNAVMDDYDVSATMAQQAVDMVFARMKSQVVQKVSQNFTPNTSTRTALQANREAREARRAARNIHNGVVFDCEIRNALLAIIAGTQNGVIKIDDTAKAIDDLFTMFNSGNMSLLQIDINTGLMGLLSELSESLIEFDGEEEELRIQDIGTDIEDIVADIKIAYNTHTPSDRRI